MYKHSMGNPITPQAFDHWLPGSEQCKEKSVLLLLKSVVPKKPGHLTYGAGCNISTQWKSKENALATKVAEILQTTILTNTKESPWAFWEQVRKAQLQELRTQLKILMGMKMPLWFYCFECEPCNPPVLISQEWNCSLTPISKSHFQIYFQTPTLTINLISQTTSTSPFLPELFRYIVNRPPSKGFHFNDKRGV